METVQLVITGISFVLGVVGVATVFTNGFVKASRISILESRVNQLWEAIKDVAVIQSRLGYIEKSVDEIKDLLKGK